MMVGRFGGDSVQVRVGRSRMTDLAGGCALVGASLATLVASVPVALCGFAVLGLGTSVLFPQLYDAAAKAPGRRGSGFTALLIGQRIGTTVLPVIVASLADTDRFDFGAAIAVLLIPTSLIVLVGGRTVVRLAPTEPTR
jgi:fucose permease